MGGGHDDEPGGRQEQTHQCQQADVQRQAGHERPDAVGVRGSLGPAPPQRERPNDDRGQRHTDRPFRQQSARKGHACDEQPLPAARIRPEGPRGHNGDEGCPGPQGDEAGEHQIRQRLTGDRHVAEARRRDCTRQQPGGLVVPPSGARVGGQHQHQTGYSRGDARREFADTAPPIAERRQPVVEHRFLEPILAVVARRDPVAARDHLACGLGVERLVGIGDRRSAEPNEERQDAEQHQQGDARRRHVRIVYRGQASR